MRLVFAGTPDFAARALAAILEAGHEVALVLAQPDRPAGRGLRPAPSAVKVLAEQHRLPLHQPETLKTPDAASRIAAVHPEIMVVAAYGLILPAAVLGVPTRGAVNIHASLLPRWRGAAPIQRAILAGDAATGISIMQMDAGLDTGPVLGQRAIPIAADDDAGSLHDRLAKLGAEMVVEALDALSRGDAQAVPQREENACYARKIERAETVLDWSQPAAVLERVVRAFRPAPGAAAAWRAGVLKIWRARVGPGAGAPGTVLAAEASALRIACGEGALEILEVQRPGGRRLPVADFLRGSPMHIGERLGASR